MGARRRGDGELTGMATEEQIQAVMFRIGEAISCGRCGSALRYGDYECPHCGEDMEDQLRQWARDLVDDIAAARRADETRPGKA